MAIPADPWAAVVQQANGIITMLGPFQNFVPITPSDTIQFAPTLAIHAGTAGTIIVDGAGGGTSVPLTLLAGVDYGYRVTRVYAASTSSIGLVGLY